MSQWTIVGRGGSVGSHTRLTRLTNAVAGRKGRMHSACPFFFFFRPRHGATNTDGSLLRALPTHQLSTSNLGEPQAAAYQAPAGCCMLLSLRRLVAHCGLRPFSPAPVVPAVAPPARSSRPLLNSGGRLPWRTARCSAVSHSAPLSGGRDGMPPKAKFYAVSYRARLTRVGPAVSWPPFLLVQS